LFESQVDALFAYVAIEECPDLDPAQAFGGDVEGLADAPCGGIDGGAVDVRGGAEVRTRPIMNRPPILQVFDLYVTVGCVDGERRASAI
jgi:hypothetical protein